MCFLVEVVLLYEEKTYMREQDDCSNLYVALLSLAKV